MKRMTRSFLAALCVVLVAAILPRAGTAQDFLPGERARAVLMACRADYVRFCSDVPPGRGRILRCMTRHADVVSQPCFQALTAWGLTAVNAFKMCLPDVAALCPQVPPRSAHALTCLLQNSDKLSRVCHDSLAEQGLLDGGGEPRPNGSAPRRP